MAINRRNFIKGIGAGVACSVLPSSMVFAENRKLFSGDRLVFPRLRYDVIVVGAGPAGIPAAIAAARSGARVVLIEEDMAPGGAPVDMFVTFMCGGPRVGLFRRLVQDLNRSYPLGGRPSDTFGEAGGDGKNHWWMPSSFQQAYQRMIAEQKNITLMCGAPVVDTLVEASGNRNRVKGVRVMRNGVFQEIEAPVTIDATGTGLVAATAGCQVMYGSEAESDFGESYGLEVSDGKVQPCTQMYISQRVRNDARFPIDSFKSGVLENDHRRWAQEQNREEFYRNNTGIFLHWGVSVFCKDTTDPVQVAEAQAKALAGQSKMMQDLQDAGCCGHLAPKSGIRECRRIKGDTVVTVDDLFNGTQPDDKIADARYAIDAWGWNIPEEVKRKVKPYGIPYRALVPLDTEGLLTAGRIISGTRLAHSSYRVQPICSSIGEAAGTAAAMASLNKTSVRNIDVRKLQSELEGYGLFDASK